MHAHMFARACHHGDGGPFSTERPRRATCRRGVRRGRHIVRRPVLRLVFGLAGKQRALLSQRGVYLVDPSHELIAALCVRTELRVSHRDERFNCASKGQGRYVATCRRGGTFSDARRTGVGERHRSSCKFNCPFKLCTALITNSTTAIPPDVVSAIRAESNATPQARFARVSSSCFEHNHSPDPVQILPAADGSMEHLIMNSREAAQREDFVAFIKLYAQARPN